MERIKVEPDLGLTSANSMGEDFAESDAYRDDAGSSIQRTIFEARNPTTNQRHDQPHRLTLPEILHQQKEPARGARLVIDPLKSTKDLATSKPARSAQRSTKMKPSSRHCTEVRFLGIEAFYFEPLGLLFLGYGFDGCDIFARKAEGDGKTGIEIFSQTDNDTRKNSLNVLDIQSMHIVTATMLEKVRGRTHLHKVEDLVLKGLEIVVDTLMDCQGVVATFSQAKWDSAKGELQKLEKVAISRTGSCNSCANIDPDECGTRIRRDKTANSKFDASNSVPRSGKLKRSLPNVSEMPQIIGRPSLDESVSIKLEDETAGHKRRKLQSQYGNENQLPTGCQKASRQNNDQPNMEKSKIHANDVLMRNQNSDDRIDKPEHIPMVSARQQSGLAKETTSPIMNIGEDSKSEESAPQSQNPYISAITKWLRNLSAEDWACMKKYCNDELARWEKRKKPDL